MGNLEKLRTGFGGRTIRLDIMDRGHTCVSARPRSNAWLSRLWHPFVYLCNFKSPHSSDLVMAAGIRSV